MKIAIDLDDVTVAIMDGLTKFHNEKYKQNITVEDHVYFSLDKVWMCTPEEAMKRVYEFYNSSYMDKLLPMTGAVEGINTLKKDHDLLYVTSRPLITKNKTINWLNKYFPNNNLPVYFSNQFSPDNQKKIKKSEILRSLNTHLLIDDSPTNVEDCVSENIKVLLYTRPWNVNLDKHDLVTRVNNWQEVITTISNFSI